MTTIKLIETFGGAWHVEQNADDIPFSGTYCGKRVVAHNSTEHPAEGLSYFGAVCRDCVAAARNPGAMSAPGRD